MRRVYREITITQLSHETASFQTIFFEVQKMINRLEKKNKNYKIKIFQKLFNYLRITPLIEK